MSTARASKLCVVFALALSACGNGNVGPDAQADGIDATNATDVVDTVEAADVASDSIDAPDSADAGPVMLLVPAGPFSMGCNAAIDTQCAPDENPQHTVTVSAFEIDATEVTQGDYQPCVYAGVCTAPQLTGTDRLLRPTHPVVGVDDVQAATYCAWRGKRLPTEAEWEKAARGTDGRIYPWGNDPPDCTLANSYGCSGSTDPVGSHPTGASPYGVLDMAGNVEEWVSDLYDPNYYSQSPSIDPVGPTCGPHRVRRGGTFLYITAFLRTSGRGDMDPPGPSPSLGFRCARSVGGTFDAGTIFGGDAACFDAGSQ